MVLAATGCATARTLDAAKPGVACGVLRHAAEFLCVAGRVQCRRQVCRAGHVLSGTGSAGKHGAGYGAFAVVGADGSGSGVSGFRRALGSV